MVYNIPEASYGRGLLLLVQSVPEMQEAPLSVIQILDAPTSSAGSVHLVNSENGSSYFRVDCFPEVSITVVTEMNTSLFVGNEIGVFRLFSVECYWLQVFLLSSRLC